MNTQQLITAAQQHDTQKRLTPNDQRSWPYTTGWEVGEEILTKFPTIDREAVYLTNALAEVARG